MSEVAIQPDLETEALEEVESFDDRDFRKPDSLNQNEQQEQEVVEDEADFAGGEEQLRSILGCEIEKTNSAAYKIKITRDGEATISSYHGESKIDDYSLDPYQVESDEEGGYIAILVAEREENGFKIYTFQSQVYKKIEQEAPLETIEQPGEDILTTEDWSGEVNSFWPEEFQPEQAVENQFIATNAAAALEQTQSIEEPQATEEIAAEVESNEQVNTIPQPVEQLQPIVTEANTLQEVILETPAMTPEAAVTLVDHATSEVKPLGIPVTEAAVTTPLPVEQPPTVIVERQTIISKENLIAQENSEAPIRVADKMTYLAPDEKVTQELQSQESTTETSAIAEEKTTSEPIKIEKPVTNEAPQIVHDAALEVTTVVPLEKPVDDLAIDYKAELTLKQETSSVRVPAEPQRSFIAYQTKDEGSSSAEAALLESPIDVTEKPLALEPIPPPGWNQASTTATKNPPMLKTEKPIEIKQPKIAAAFPETTKTAETVEDNLATSYDPAAPRQIAPETAINTEPLVIEEKIIRPVPAIENKTEAITVNQSELTRVVNEVAPPEVVQHVTFEKQGSIKTDTPINAKPSVEVPQENLASVTKVAPLSPSEPRPVQPPEVLPVTSEPNNTVAMPDITPIGPSPITPTVPVNEIASVAMPEPTPVTPVSSEQPTFPVLPTTEGSLAVESNTRIQAETPTTQLQPEIISTVSQLPASPEASVPIRAEGAPENIPTQQQVERLAKPTPTPEIPQLKILPLSPEVAEDIAEILKTRPVAQRETPPPLFPPEIPVRTQDIITTQSFSEVIATLEAAPLGTTIEIVGPVDEDGTVQDITILERTHSVAGEPTIQQKFFERPAPAAEKPEPVPFRADWEVTTGAFATTHKEKEAPTIVITERDIVPPRMVLTPKSNKKAHLTTAETVRSATKPQPALIFTVTDQTATQTSTATPPPLTVRTYAAN